MLKLIYSLLLLCPITVVIGQENKPKIVAVYPTTDSIPVNILRFYIQFSAPMQEMNILNHLKLGNEDGKNISGVFFENQYELWNENRTEVTLIVDPGRVKLGLLANNTMGRAFDEGKKYTLIIDSLLMDFNDQKLNKSFTKTFVAVKEDRQPPDTKLWQLTFPKANSTEPILIDFKDKIDHISAKTLIKIFKNKKEIAGKIKLENEEQLGTFTPNKKWAKGDYQILINPRLEDIAANSINQIFDHKPSDFKQKNDANLILNFTIQ
ncbi:hypothetical protein [Pedobacter helvus]|uniref:SbsA Ig-like domain-containing protein n=1 Tax=Pedobacter helvus TaxID=2563444 RepID=A0ABW9JGE1_9SPHI|nr:hypothetical protein [Pedobacter ureilyticus]